MGDVCAGSRSDELKWVGVLTNSSGEGSIYPTLNIQTPFGSFWESTYPCKNTENHQTTAATTTTTTDPKNHAVLCPALSRAQAQRRLLGALGSLLSIEAVASSLRLSRWCTGGTPASNWWWDRRSNGSLLGCLVVFLFEKDLLSQTELCRWCFWRP